MKLKAWPCYSGSPGIYSCTLVLENGWAPFGHLCSHPNFAPGDLYYGRPERMKAMEEMGIEIDMQAVCLASDVPSEVIEKHKSEEWKPFSDKIKNILADE